MVRTSIAEFLQRLHTLGRHLRLPNTELNQRVASSSKLSTHTGHQGIASPSIIAQPKVALYDEQIKIILKGFPSLEKVTLHGEMIQGSKKIAFGSCGQYVTNRDGEVDVSQEPSLGGSYTGLEPMGIVWSLTPAPGHPQQTRMAINFTSKPCIITLRGYRGHLDLNDIYGDPRNTIESIAQTQIERWFRHKDITRIEIKEGNLRGALFLPPGNGPFQGVIDMFGSSGGLIEYRAALLASRGFAAFALAYINYKDLPYDLTTLGYDYFEEAVNWFSQHPKVHKGGIGVCGVSKGAEYALCMGAFHPHVTAAVAINSLPTLCIADLLYKGETLLKGSPFSIDLDNADYVDGAMKLIDNIHLTGDIIPVWKGKSKILVLVSMDDHQVDAEHHKRLLDECSEEKRQDIEVVQYPGAGHLLEPPYNALCRASVNRGFGILMSWGGNPVEHARAQEDSWQRILNFFRQNIPTM